MFYKSQYSAPEDYDIDVLEGLKNRGVIEDYKFEKQSQIFIQQAADSEFVLIKENKALKTINKLMMNSVYGRFG